MKKTKDYNAAEYVLSIILYESASVETRQIGLTSYKKTYTVPINKEMLIGLLPVLLKYVDKDSIGDCIKNAQKRALSKKVRGWLWWLSFSFFVSIMLVFLNLSLARIVFAILTIIDTIVFIKRKKLGKIWKDAGYDQEKRTIAFEKMMEQC